MLSYKWPALAEHTHRKVSERQRFIQMLLLMQSHALLYSPGFFFFFLMNAGMKLNQERKADCLFYLHTVFFLPTLSSVSCFPLPPLPPPSLLIPAAGGVCQACGPMKDLGQLTTAGRSVARGDFSFKLHGL